MRNPIAPAYRVPFWLVLYSIFPVGATVTRAMWFMSDYDVAQLDARLAGFHAAPEPLVIHLIFGNIFGLLGAFQFSRALRMRNPSGHKTRGRVVLATGLIAAVSGVWMTVIYPLGPMATDLLTAIRFGFGCAMVGCLALALRAIIRRRFQTHGAWMMRAYAIGLGGSTQAVLLILTLVIMGTLTSAVVTVMIGLGWVINLGFAEWRIRQMARANTERAPVAPT